MNVRIELHNEIDIVTHANFGQSENVLYVVPRHFRMSALQMQLTHGLILIKVQSHSSCAVCWPVVEI